MGHKVYVDGKRIGWAVFASEEHRYTRYKVISVKLLDNDYTYHVIELGRVKYGDRVVDKKVYYPSYGAPRHRTGVVDLVKEDKVGVQWDVADTDIRIKSHVMISVARVEVLTGPMFKTNI